MGIVCFFPAMPFFIEEPKDEVSSEEEDIEFTCKAGGVPAPAVEWSFNGELYDSTTSEWCIFTQCLTNFNFQAYNYNV